MKGITVGFAICGSFCTISRAVDIMKKLVDEGYDILPILSNNVSRMDTRFGKAEELKSRIKDICKRDIITTIEDAEPIGPKKMTDIMIVAPCTGNTAAKLANAITDTPVTMAVKSHLRQQKPVLLAFASNDALGASAQNIGKLINTKHIYFVPMSQDDPAKKPNSLVAHFEMIPDSLRAALNHQQLQPVFA